MYFTAQTRPKIIISVSPKRGAQAPQKVNIGNMTEAQAKQYILEIKRGK